MHEPGSLTIEATTVVESFSRAIRAGTILSRSHDPTVRLTVLGSAMGQTDSLDALAMDDSETMASTVPQRCWDGGTRREAEDPTGALLHIVPYRTIIGTI